MSDQMAAVQPAGYQVPSKLTAAVQSAGYKPVTDSLGQGVSIAEHLLTPVEKVTRVYNPVSKSSGVGGTKSPVSEPAKDVKFGTFMSDLTEVVSKLGYNVYGVDLGVGEGGGVVVKNLELRRAQDAANMLADLYSQVTGTWGPGAGGRKATIFDYMLGYERMDLASNPEIVGWNAYYQGILFNGYSQDQGVFAQGGYTMMEGEEYGYTYY
jgi:hypothetical protein